MKQIARLRIAEGDFMLTSFRRAVAATVMAGAPLAHAAVVTDAAGRIVRDS
ncbi:hypothetical protein ABZ153_10530 [Streptomyces sp. NPDC006290]|uniref:hypothetical protein n=1 Tax=Streptomyces sp. NPDC006290 TaxID=3156745 RepID=UPI0033BF2C84